MVTGLDGKKSRERKSVDRVWSVVNGNCLVKSFLSFSNWFYAPAVLLFRCRDKFVASSRRSKRALPPNLSRVRASLELNSVFRIV